MGNELALPINFTFRDIDDVLSLNNSKFDVCVDHIYHIEPTIKATKDTDKATPNIEYTHIIWQWALIKNENNDKETILIFPISDFLFTRSKSRAEPAYGLYISHLCPYHINSFDYAGSGNVISLYCFRFAPFVF